MKRDMEAVRTIMFAIEAEKEEIVVAGMSEELLCKHIAIMVDGGLIKGMDVTNNGSPCDEEYQDLKLTWAGAEFLDAIRNDSVWEKTKAEVKKNGVGLALGWVKEIAIGFGRKLFSLP